MKRITINVKGDDPNSDLMKMNQLTRRSFLKGCAIAPIALAVAPMAAIAQIPIVRPGEVLDQQYGNSLTVQDWGNGVVVPAGGTTVNFSRRFASPLIQLAAVEGSIKWAIVTNKTRLGFTVKVYDTAGTDVGGIIDWCGIESRSQKSNYY